MIPDTQDRDLYCLHCGYNLRGLMTDPRRCPECGQENAVNDLLVPAREIKKALEALESAPAMATGAIVVVVAWLIPVMIMVFSAGAPIIAWVGVMIGILVCTAVYIIGVRRFRATCGRGARWGSALLWHHMFGLLTAVCVTAFIGICGYLLVALYLGFGTPIRVATPRQAYFWSAIGVVSFAGTWFFGRLAKRSIVPLQRKRAAEMARGYVHQLEL